MYSVTHERTPIHTYKVLLSFTQTHNGKQSMQIDRSADMCAELDVHIDQVSISCWGPTHRDMHIHVPNTHISNLWGPCAVPTMECDYVAGSHTHTHTHKNTDTDKHTHTGILRLKMVHRHTHKQTHLHTHIHTLTHTHPKGWFVRTKCQQRSVIMCLYN